MTMLNENIETKNEERKIMANQVKTNWFSLSGRATRREWWHQAFGWGGLLSIVGLLLLSVGLQYNADEDTQILGCLCVFVSLISLIVGGIIGFTVSIRRFHDRGMSGFWYLTYFVPPAGLVGLVINGFLDGQPGTNQYGPDPKGR